MSPEKVVVDTDPAMLTWGLDVDDDLALLFLFASPEVDVVGITTTFGNTLGRLAYRDARRLVALAGRSQVPVARGAGFLNRTRETPASRFLLEVTSRYPGEITLLTLGPLTNVARAASADAEFASRLRRIVMMGGRTRSGVCEFNFRRDPASADAVLALGVERTQVSFDLAFPLVITPSDVDRIAAREGSLIARFAPRLRGFARWQDRFRGLRGRKAGQAAGGFHPWDVVAAAFLVAPDLFGDIHEVGARVDAEGCSRLESAPDPERRTRVPMVADAARLKQLILERLSKVSSC